MHKLNLKFKFHSIIISLCVLFCTHGVFAYGEDYDSADRRQVSKRQVEQVQESLKQLKESSGQSASLDQDTTLDPAKIQSGDPSAMRKAIKVLTSQSKRMSDAEVANFIKTSFEGKRFISGLASNEKFVSFTVGMIKDDNALLYLFELTQDKKTLKTAFIAMIVLIILGFFLKRQINKKTKSMLGRFCVGIIFFVFSTILKVAVIYIIYKDYLDPSIRVFKERVL